MTADDWVKAVLGIAVTVTAGWVGRQNKRMDDQDKRMTAIDERVTAHTLETAVKLKGLEVEQSGVQKTLDEIKARIETIAESVDAGAVKQAVSEGVADGVAQALRNRS